MLLLICPIWSNSHNERIGCYNAFTGNESNQNRINHLYERQKWKLAFADFLDVMHTHSSKENLPKELLDAFRCGDPQRKGVIPARDLRRILIKWGEKLSSKEGILLYVHTLYLHIISRY